MPTRRTQIRTWTTQRAYKRLKSGRPVGIYQVLCDGLRLGPRLRKHASVRLHIRRLQGCRRDGACTHSGFVCKFWEA
eukprot:336484-Chlamydomonas_euryale.AAC.1